MKIDSLVIIFILYGVFVSCTGNGFADPYRSQQKLLLEDPVIFSETAKIAEQSREIIESHPLGHLKRQSITQFLRIGQLKQNWGPNQVYSRLQMNAWTLYLSRNPTITVNGTSFGIQLISYVDGTASNEENNTAIVLTEWLVTQDKVHILSVGFNGNNIPMQIVAERLGVPCMNSADYTSGFRPPFRWTLTMLPSLLQVGSQCATALIAAGAKTFVQISDTGRTSLTNLYNYGVQAVGGIILATFNITPEMRDKPTLYDPIIKQIRDLNPDVLMGGTTEVCF